MSWGWDWGYEYRSESDTKIWIVRIVLIGILISLIVVAWWLYNISHPAVSRTEFAIADVSYSNNILTIHCYTYGIVGIRTVTGKYFIKIIHCAPHRTIRLRINMNNLCVETRRSVICF